MKKIAMVSVVGSLLLAGSVSALPITFSGSAVGSWANPVKESNGAYVNIANSDAGGTAKITWGNAASWDNTKSYLDFDGAGSDANNNPAKWSSALNPFSLGNLSFHNGSIVQNSGIKGADMNLLVKILTPNLGALSQFTYNMGINNTINPQGDTVLILGESAPVVFEYGGWDYTFSLLGFSSDGVHFSNQLFAKEENCTPVTTKIWGTICGQPEHVPDGGSTLALVGMAITGLVFLRSRVG